MEVGAVTPSDADAPRIRPAVPNVVLQHMDELSCLAQSRLDLVNSPNVTLRQLARADERLLANIDGLDVAGDLGAKAIASALGAQGPGEVFAATTRALGNGDLLELRKCFALGASSPHAEDCLSAAFSWASLRSLEKVLQPMLGSANSFVRGVGVVACCHHRIDPGERLPAILTDDSLKLRSHGLRAAGECGRLDLRGACGGELGRGAIELRFFAARSVAFLGDVNRAAEALIRIVTSPGPYRAPALGLLLKIATREQAASLLKSLSMDACNLRILIRSAGIAGDASLVPWLIKQMSDLASSRLAGEAFSLITGADLAWLDLERNPPEGVDVGPNDDPNDGNVSMDEDEGLPWPDPAKVQTWWASNALRFQLGARYFMGAPPTWEHCLKVLKDGYQRQRMAAAEYLCLLRPGTKLFNCGAPAWRQQRWLAELH